MARNGQDIDILDPRALFAYAHGQSAAVAWMVNCAAYTAVDKAEQEPKLTEAVNVHGARNVARLAADLGAKLVHISSDYVFGGPALLGFDGQPRAWRENDPVGPVCVYGQTKAQGEKLVRTTCHKS